MSCVTVKAPESTSATISVPTNGQTASTSSGPDGVELVTVLVLTLQNQAHLLVLETYLY